MAMVPAHFHAIRRISGRRESWRLRVKVVRLWNMAPVAKPNDPFATQMVLVDEEVLFNANTRVIPCQRVGIPLPGLSLVKTTDIKKTNGKSDFLIGCVLGEIRLAVFGNMIDVVAGFLTLPRCGLPVLIVQLAKVNLYKGEVGIQNVMNATKFLWNPDLVEAIEFKNGLAVHEIETELEIGIISQRNRPVSLKEEFLHLYPNKALSQLQEANEDGSLIILGTVEQLLHEGFWWYMACKCMKAVSYDDGVPYCEDWESYVYELTPRYKLKMEVGDGTDSVQLILFDSECYALLNKSCRDMLSEQKVSLAEYPSEMEDVVGKELLFRVEQKEHGYEQSFRVRRVCSDLDIIAEYKAGIERGTPLKMKFDPSFSKIGAGNVNECVMEVSPQCPSAVTEIEVSPIACMQLPPAVDDGGSALKRDHEEPTDGALERKRRGRVKNMKLERS
ncbi:hypothetical protein SESBI_33672 [Sesbania bispinosa]|nr:hypothetical protein SESBI_33672 [Sesbania bispinosa]